MSISIHAPLRWFNLHPWWTRAEVPVWGARLKAPSFDRWLALRLHQLGLMGVADRRFFEAHIRPGMTVVDIGANQGLYSLLFARLAGDTGTVWSFEPDDLLYHALVHNVAVRNRAANVQTRHVALGARAGTMTLHRSLLNSGDNRLAANAGNAGPREAVTIRVERLDEALAGERIDFIKLDVQGWEAEVFQGMQGLLDDPRNDGIVIYFEFWPQGLRDSGSDPVRLLNFLAANRFQIHQPRAGDCGPIIKDLSRLADSLKGEAYTNLFASRPTTKLPLPKCETHSVSTP